MRKFIYLFFLVCIIVSCARMGNPDGGWYDDTPPKVIGCNPADRDTNVHSRKIAIYFDEFIKLEDAANKVIVSPPQLEMPEIKATGKRVLVSLKDSLKPNVTYTIDFADAITDNNENNPMGNYTYSFSTGTKIDTFEVSGYVLDASNLEPIKGILVGLYDNVADSAFTTQPLLRVSLTNGSGRFVVKGVAPGSYRCYALQDADGNYRFSQKSEMIAFSHSVYQPASMPAIRQDTVWRDSLHIDSIIRVPYTRFIPDDIVLLAFQEPQTDRYFLKSERIDEHKFTLYFSYGDENLPQLRALNFNEGSGFVVESNVRKDTITYWLRDTALVSQDTLRMLMQYMATDTLGRLSLQTDTMEILAKTPYAKRLKNMQRDREEWEKEQKKLREHGEPYDSVMKPVMLQPNYNVPSLLDPDKNIIVEMPYPLSHYDSTAIHLYAKHDSLWYRSKVRFQPVEGKLRRYELIGEWKPGVEYSLEIDSLAFTDIYGHQSDPATFGFKVHPLTDYGSLFVTLGDIHDSCVQVQLLDGQDKVVKQVRAIDNHADFYYLNPGKYYIRCFADSNGNGVWDTGIYHDNLQPESVYYYPRSIECKTNWELNISWNDVTGNRYKQKPSEITKQKPDQEKKLRNRNAKRAADLGIKYTPKY